MGKHTMVTPIEQWLPANQSFYGVFQRWLRQGGYGPSALNLYSMGVRIALGLLEKPYWTIDLVGDLTRVHEYLATHYPSDATRSTYAKGLVKLEQYLRQHSHRAPPERAVNWDHYVGSLPDWLIVDVRAYVTHCRRAWPAETQHLHMRSTLSRLTGSLRWMTAQAHLPSLEEITPARWFDYLDTRLAAGIQPITTNMELQQIQSLLRFLTEQGRPTCQRTLLITPLSTGTCLPRDVPVEQLRRLLAEIAFAADSLHAGIRRMGGMDRAWVLLMLHSGLRSGEVRRLRRSDVDVERRRARIEQSKGLKDRIVCLSSDAVDALQSYLAIRGPAEVDHVFIYRHLPLTVSYCSERLRTYGERCGVRVTPHQLRHSCATLLLNAGAPILTVQTILGHKHIDTTLGYARLYDGTVAADYYRAMEGVERRLSTQESDPTMVRPRSGHLLALVDSLRQGTLNDSQREILQSLRTSILALEDMILSEAVKTPATE